MARWRIRPTKMDRRVANRIASRTSPAIEKPASFLTLAADEKSLLAFAAGLWLLSGYVGPRRRREARYVATNIMVTAVLPHLCKSLIAQKRPDRYVNGRHRGIPRSGKAYDAFPSGHAMHVGAVASALSRFFPAATPMIWTVGGLLAATRIILLAHWITDVLVGLVSGMAVEHILWLLLKPDFKSIKTNPYCRRS
jgi:membrane-associated phospholipid phosphatase